MRSDTSSENGDSQDALCALGDEVPDLSTASGSDSPGKPNIVSRCALALIGMYQFVSRHTPPVCKFRPTCSEYTRQAIVKYGFIKGSLMGAYRILRCNPFSKGGYDPVP